MVAHPVPLLNMRTPSRSSFSGSERESKMNLGKPIFSALAALALVVAFVIRVTGASTGYCYFEGTFEVTTNPLNVTLPANK
jgi:hypothetical protein